MVGRLHDESYDIAHLLWEDKKGISMTLPCDNIVITAKRPVSTRRSASDARDTYVLWYHSKVRKSSTLTGTH